MPMSAPSRDCARLDNIGRYKTEPFHNAGMFVANFFAGDEKASAAIKRRLPCGLHEIVAR